MSDQFQVGEIAIAVNQVYPYEHLNGAEVEIIGELTRRVGWCRFLQCEVIGDFYHIKCGAEEFLAAPKDLRKKPPPSSNTGELRILELFKQPPVPQPEKSFPKEICSMSELFSIEPVRTDAQQAAIMGKGEDANPYTQPMLNAAWLGFYWEQIERNEQGENA